MILGSTFSETAWSACESVIRRFEDAWRDQERPVIDDFRTSGSPHEVRLLVELVHIDMEFRLRAGDFARSEDYIARFPELSDPELELELLEAEYALRNRHTPPAWPEEFLLRFPSRMAELRTRLPVDGSTGSFVATRLPNDRPGAPLPGLPVITGYEIQGELGRGGMGVVYKARDLLLQRTVAVKTFSTLPRADSCARFAREAEAIARLDHPNIVPVYEVGEWHSPEGGLAIPFFVMKWYPGGSLDATPSGAGTDVRSQAKGVEVIARAVHHAHQRGVLHRDLKPSNILLDSAGAPHVADFGLAGRIDPDAPSVTAVVAGTPAYMAPEQARTPKQVSTAADVYGLGAILYHRLTGQPPFMAETLLATLDLVANAVPARPSSMNPAVPRDLETICLKCLEKYAERRYGSAAELAEDLNRWRHGLPIAARPASALELGLRRVRRHPVVSGLVCLTLAALVGGIVVLADSNERIRVKERETHEAYLRECAMRYKLEESLQREQRALYLERVSAAGRLYAANKLPEAWALLEQCPVAFRGWEWRYLEALRRAQPVALAGHTATVTAVVHIADGRMVSADAIGGVRVWDAAGQRCEREWKCGEARVVTLAAHPTKDWVAVADTGSVTVWEVGTGRRLATLDGSDWAAFAPDCPRLMTADGSTLRMWTIPAFLPRPGDPRPLAEWKQEWALYGHKGRVRSGAFTPEGSLLFTTATDGTIRSWAVSRGVEVFGRTVPAPVSGLALAAGGKMLVETHVGCVLFTDPGTGEMRDRLDHPTGDQSPVAVSQDGRLVAVGGANGELVVWDVVDRRKRVYRGHPGRVISLSFGRDGRLAACGGDQSLRVWDIKEEQAVRTLAWIGNGVGGLAVSPDGSHIAIGPRNVADSTATNAIILDASTGRALQNVACGPDLGFHPTCGRLVIRRRDGTTSLHEPSTAGVVWTKSSTNPSPANTSVGRRLALSLDGTLLAICAGGGVVQLSHPANGTSLGVIDTGKSDVHAIDLVPDGSRMAVATADSVCIWDVRARSQIAWRERVSGAVSVAFSPDGQWIAVAESDGSVRLRDSSTGQEVRHFVGTGLRVDVLCFNPDGTRLVTGGADRTLRVWDVESGRELLSLPGITEAVTGLAWDGKNDRLYAVDHAVRIWGTK